MVHSKKSVKDVETINRFAKRIQISEQDVEDPIGDKSEIYLIFHIFQNNAVSPGQEYLSEENR